MNFRVFRTDRYVFQRIIVVKSFEELFEKNVSTVALKKEVCLDLVYKS